MLCVRYKEGDSLPKVTQQACHKVTIYSGSQSPRPILQTSIHRLLEKCKKSKLSGKPEIQRERHAAQVLFALPVPRVASLYSISGEVGRSSLGAEERFQGEMEQDRMKALTRAAGIASSRCWGQVGPKCGGWKSPMEARHP